MTEDDHSVCGEIDHGRLPLVRAAAREVLPAEAVSVYTSGFDGQRLLRLSIGDVDLETMQGSTELFGGVAGSNIAEARAFLRSFSSALAAREVVHRFEVYNREQELVEEFSYGR